MLVKLVTDIVKTQTTTCGEVDMILGSADYSKLNVAICPNIKPTIAHFHPEFDEIYFMLDGWIHIKTYDPATGRYAEQRIGPNELAFFPKGMHHVIDQASDVNRLCVLMIPGFLGEVPSDKL
jgi:mannose-6-phosphate isomerase-like protein (cupin superfamily)